MNKALFGRMLHGGDYNPEQWLDRPEILAADREYFRRMHINTVSLGMFSWAVLEPCEGVFNFDWLVQIIDALYAAGVSVIMATPSGARPKWLADAYPEVLRVDAERRRALFGGRHNHCYTSPVYREKVKIINTEIVRRVGRHPAVLAWHISNEYGGECYCPLCQEAFRSWLAARYGTIDKLNDAWQTVFWSHVYTDFSQIEAPSPIGEHALHGLTLDWKRFVTARTADFASFEIETIRAAGSDKPATVNMMYDYAGLDYERFAGTVDIISWDNYPPWHKTEEKITALDAAMQHDYMRSLKKAPFLLMESCPSATNWQAVSKLKRPGMLLASSLQAVAHGADSVLYFQMRQSRGASEKFHGAAIDHWGGETRVMNEITDVGLALESLGAVCGSTVHAAAAIIMDRESRWAMEDAAGPRNAGLKYKVLFTRIYNGLRRGGAAVDIISEERDISAYRIVAVPMAYMCKPGFTEKLRAFVSSGGTLVVSYWSGIVDEYDRCCLNGTPHGLTDVLGLRSCEIDALYDGEQNAAIPVAGNALGLTRRYVCDTLCDVVDLCGAMPVLTYTDDFYAGRAALTFKQFGAGTAWYIGALFEEELFSDIFCRLVTTAGAAQPYAMRLFGGSSVPEGVGVTTRENDDAAYVFVQNFNRFSLCLPSKVLPKGASVLYGTYTGFLAPLETLVFAFSKT